MREKVCGSEADRKSEKSDMAESLRCPPPLPPHPPHPPLPLQMEVNVKQSLLLVSGGINSLERDWAAREVNACLSAQPPPAVLFPLPSRGAACCIPTLHAPSPGHRRERSKSDIKAFFFLEAQ